MTELNNNLDNQDYLNTDNDKMQDASNADAAKFNTDEQEQAINERMADESDVAESEDVAASGEQAEINNDLGTELGGITNLSLDQLKEERDPEGNDIDE